VALAPCPLDPWFCYDSFPDYFSSFPPTFFSGRVKPILVSPNLVVFLPLWLCSSSILLQLHLHLRAVTPSIFRTFLSFQSRPLAFFLVDRSLLSRRDPFFGRESFVSFDSNLVSRFGIWSFFFYNSGFFFPPQPMYFLREGNVSLTPVPLPCFRFIFGPLLPPPPRLHQSR